MTRLPACLIAALLAAPSIAAAQTPASQLTTLSGGMRSLYQAIRRNIVEAAELMPEQEYAFKPTPDVRSFGQLVGHLANTQYNFCAAALGVASPNRMNLETLATKAELVKALQDAVAFCDPAYDKLTDADAPAAAAFGSAKITKGYALVYNIAHDNEHYGNMVTYLRMKGLVPPSSARNGR